MASDRRPRGRVRRLAGLRPSPAGADLTGGPRATVEIARRAGISSPAVGRIAQEVGHTFDRTETARATEARAIDMRGEPLARFAATFALPPSFAGPSLG